MRNLDIFSKKKVQTPVTDNKTTEYIFKKILEQMGQNPPSEHFASGAVFDLVRQNHDMFENIVHIRNVSSLQLFFVKAYTLFCNQPQVVGFTSAMVDQSKNDTDPRMWNADIIQVASGEVIALCFMPIQHETLLARIVGIVLSDKGDQYYYCMLNKNTATFSDVIHNKAIQGIEKVGEVRGTGYELMNDFVNVINSNLTYFI